MAVGRHRPHTCGAVMAANDRPAVRGRLTLQVAFTPDKQNTGQSDKGEEGESR